MARLFFALQPPVGDRQALASLLPARFAPLARRPLRPDNLHLTLCFLGEAPDAAIPLLLSLARPFAGAHVAFALDRMDYWPRPALLAALPREDESLQQVISLAAALQAMTREAGFSPDGRAFRPHVTLLRLRAPARLAGESWPQSLAASVCWNCDSVVLMRSDPGPDGPTYRKVRD